ncbi:d-isomer specific 2-hydroxyacid dehydrogenase, NAD binding domain-containing protein [Trichoderma breve]|uniref:D-isomer specific 2-hydroxyacid dehydrogenase, NAD binding domain-containing protein n=1 Tax=Trichoderma breve TaxID=2034170 RepID=A0A9W9BB11_9HYPO|nr:d-isomer specific 2-hydroxyacid dehydrogenase, NAD binding domain-containing protein [Trichoderma breve]KAJ4858024.1 d-isomer specific 2-hydroxyacid dehydrogenase, NAD binding domain-containing protein [Trichoderma breve]
MAPTANRTLDGHKLLVLLGVTGPPKSLLGTEFRLEWIAELKELFPGLEIVTVRDTTWNTPSFQKKFPNEEWKDLEYVQLQSAGANHVLDHPLIRETNVALCTASGVHGPQIAEWVVTTFLAFQHQITRYVDIQRQSRWQKLAEPVNDAVQQRVGILGYGAVGRQVARVLKALGMDVYVCTLHPRLSPESRRDETYTPAGLGDPEGILPSKWFSAGDTEGLHEFLSSGLDLLVITLPLTRNTRGLISRNELAFLAKQKTFVSNVGRGEIIKTDDLIDALEDGVIRGAALDVTDPEPLPDGHRLWSTKNLFISPHVSGDSSAYAQRIYEVLKYNLIRLSEGRELTNKVNRNEGY